MRLRSFVSWKLKVASLGMTPIAEHGDCSVIQAPIKLKKKIVNLGLLSVPLSLK